MPVLKDGVEVLDVDVAANQADLNTIITNVDDNHTDIGTAITDIGTNLTAIGVNTTALTDLDGDVVNVAAQVTNLDGALVAAQAVIDNTHGDLETAQAGITANQGDLNAIIAAAAFQERVAVGTIDLDQGAAAYELWTCNNDHLIVEAITIRLPDVNCSDDEDHGFTGISIHTDDTTVQSFIPQADGVKANLTAETSITWQGFQMMDVGNMIKLTIYGGAVDAATACDVIVKYRPIVVGATLAHS